MQKDPANRIIKRAQARRMCRRVRSQGHRRYTHYRRTRLSEIRQCKHGDARTRRGACRRVFQPRPEHLRAVANWIASGGWQTPMPEAAMRRADRSQHQQHACDRANVDEFPAACHQHCKTRLGGVQRLYLLSNESVMFAIMLRRRRANAATHVGAVRARVACLPSGSRLRARAQYRVHLDR